MNDSSRFTDLSEDSASRTRFGDGRHTSRNERMTTADVLIFVGACIGLAFLTAIIQTGFFFNFRPFGFAPDLCLALAAVAGLKVGPKCGSVVGISAGFFIDAFSNAGISLSIPLYLAVGIVMGILASPASSPNLSNLSLFLIGIGASALVSSFASILLVCVTNSSPDIWLILTRSIFPEILCTLIFSFFVYACASLIWRIIRKKQGFNNSRI